MVLNRRRWRLDLAQLLLSLVNCFSTYYFEILQTQQLTTWASTCLRLLLPRSSVEKNTTSISVYNAPKTLLLSFEAFYIQICTHKIYPYFSVSSIVSFYNFYNGNIKKTYVLDAIDIFINFVNVLVAVAGRQNTGCCRAPVQSKTFSLKNNA